MIHAIVTLDLEKDRVHSLIFRVESQGNSRDGLMVKQSIKIDRSEIDKYKLFYPIGLSIRELTSQRRVKSILDNQSAPSAMSVEASSIVDSVINKM